MVEFGEVAYSTDEGRTTTLLIVTNRVADRDIEVSLATFDGSATGEETVGGLFDLSSNGSFLYSFRS